MIRKRIVAMSCILTLAFGLTGCGTSNNNTSTSGSGSAEVTVTDDSGQPSDLVSEEPEASTDAEAVAIDQLAEPEKGETIATFNIKDYGTIKVRFFKDAAPKAVENFVTLAKQGYYDGVTFHRVIQDFMIQGGDPEGTGMGGESMWGESFEDEINPYLIPLRGALCMANAGGGNTNGSQFFIVQSDEIVSTDKQQVQDQLDYYVNYYKNSTGLTLSSYDESVIENYIKVGGCISLCGGYSVFGQVYEGLEVVDKIAAVSTNENDKPTSDVVIESIDVSTY